MIVSLRDAQGSNSKFIHCLVFDGRETAGKALVSFNAFFELVPRDQDIWHFHATPSPELDALKAAARHVHLSGHWLELATYGAIALQMQMLWLTAWSAKHCMKHSLLGATKLAEVARGVQTWARACRQVRWPVLLLK